MNPSERIRLISKIAERLDGKGWELIDLTLRQFDLPWSDQWGGNQYHYVVAMIEQVDDQDLIDLASHLELVQETSLQSTLPASEIEKLIQEIEQQKSLMIAVATGGPQIKTVNEEYKSNRISILAKLQNMGIQDPNPYADLWNWYGKWSDGSLPTYQSRRIYISNLFQPLLDSLMLLLKRSVIQPIELTGWVRVDRNIDKIVQSLAKAEDEEDFQTIGLLCREAMISLAQAVYDPTLHPNVDEVVPSETDAKRMLEYFISSELSGSTNEELRRYVKSIYKVAVTLQHKRSANYREAALCVEATRSLVNAIAILSGQRDL